jgi:hypothetical protein
MSIIFLTFDHPGHLNALNDHSPEILCYVKVDSLANNSDARLAPSPEVSPNILEKEDRVPHPRHS